MRIILKYESYQLHFLVLKKNGGGEWEGFLIESVTLHFTEVN